ncbi:hypothetical protein GRX03_12595 [Halovenus sp. WSH3]|uniref:Uncharacterized protein n=1 Tax=Halovenus carboxidivorans TaxID=2692199 RepID=A0A6B0TC10_9EURY|nr:hypothetical protein [Halovenus carboxidivorans]MXR52440.1 hypothetical protein [Halovenus carboxidivorans]
MAERDKAHLERAIAALSDRQYEQAGDAYSRSGWSLLAEPRAELSPFDEDEKGWVGRGLRSLAVGAIAYRVAGEQSRATRRSIEGVAVAKDLRNALTEPAQQACLLEFVADFHVIGDLSGATEAYETAATAYREGAIDSPQTWGTTPLFEAAAEPIKQLARSTANGEIAIAWEDLHGADPDQPGEFLAHRARYKRSRLPSLLDSVCESGYFAAPRGTTEYNNDQYECPDCGSHDVNWTGDNVLCMRCSHRMERR